MGLKNLLASDQMSLLNYPKIFYYSLSNNTNRYIKKLQKENYKGELVRLTEDSELEEQAEPFIMIVPTYLVGATPDTTKEIYTEVEHELLEAYDNYKNCIGIVGTGNKNFDWQYIWTAKHYCKEFNLPLLYDFEMAGMRRDVDNLIKIIHELMKTKGEK